MNEKIFVSFACNQALPERSNRVELDAVWFCIPACESSNPDWSGDSYCDDETNNDGCGFDGGDCCGPDVKTAYCTECECLGENITSTPSPGPFCSCSVEGAIGCKLIICVPNLVWNIPNFV